MLQQNQITAKGIDISYAQGTIDWEKVKSSEIEFAIIRATASYPHNGKTGVDIQWERNIREAERVGIPVGAYHYSYAESTAEIKLEAEHFIRTIAPYQFEYPVCIDFEESFQIGGNGKAGFPLEKQMDMLETFLETLESAGFFTALYSTASALCRLQAAYSVRMSKYSVWVAHVGVSKPMVPGGIWQYSWTGEVPGIRDDLPAGHPGKSADLDYAYLDFSSIIREKGLNGFAKQAQSKPYQLFTQTGCFQTLEEAQLFRKAQGGKSFIITE